MAFATTEDIATRYGRELSAIEAATAEFLIEGAMGVIAAAADKEDAWADGLTPVPRILWFVTVEVVCRAMPNPQALRSMGETLGAYQHSESYQDAAAGGGLMLTETETLLVRRAVWGRTSGSARVESTASEIHDIIYGS